MTLLKEINGFGKWLKVKREAQGLSMRALAEKADYVCSASYIAQLETNYYIGKRGNPMQPSEEIVEKLAVALDEFINEARKAANYPLIDERAEGNIRFELLKVLHKYNRLSAKSRKFANRQFKETIDFLIEVEGIKVEDVHLEDVEDIEGIADLTKPPKKPEMLSDEEISRLGIKSIRVGKIKIEAR
jgi:transcriptional regulator with XRE-family HTH domain